MAATEAIEFPKEKIVSGGKSHGQMIIRINKEPMAGTGCKQEWTIWSSLHAAAPAAVHQKPAPMQERVILMLHHQTVAARPHQPTPWPISIRLGRMEEEQEEAVVEGTTIIINKEITAAAATVAGTRGTTITVVAATKRTLHDGTHQE